MSVQFKIPQVSNLVNCQFFQVPGPCGILTGYQWDQNTQTLYAKESQVVIPSQHGVTHIAEDLVPSATCDTPGLMAADDKCKLDALLQMRIGVLGFQGAGFPDDGGFMVGDIILAAGSEFISLERIGNTVRFTVDSPIPLNCSCETCSQIFWIQDESEARAIRPPSCNGIMPDVSMYGELKVYTFPESIIVDPKDPMKALSLKGNYPAFIFKRYDNAVTPFENQLEMVLKRNSNATTQTGWSMTPGTNNLAECIWYTGKDKNGGQITFEFFSETDPGMLGALLYRGNLLTKQMAVVVDYPSDVLSTNRYTLRKWDVKNAVPIGDRFTAINVWKYSNPENSATAITNPKTLTLDATVDVLPIGTLVDTWEFEISRTSAQRIVRYFINKQPQATPSSMWSLAAAVQFGDLLTAREEINDPQTNTDISAAEINVPDVRLFEPTIWGLNSFEDRLILSDDGGEVEDSAGNKVYEPSGEPINNDIVADIDPTIPGLRILEQTKTLVGDINQDGIIDDKDLHAFMCVYGSVRGDGRYISEADFNQDGKIDIRDLALLGQQFDLAIEKVPDRPVFLWHRGNHRNVFVKAKIGMPDASATRFPPYDFLLSAPVDHFADTYMKVIRRGVVMTGPFAGSPFIVIKGVRWMDLPAEGVVRILSGAFRDAIWRYYFKAAFSPWDDDATMLIGRTDVFPFDEDFPIIQSPSDCASFCHNGSGGANGASFCDFSAGTASPGAAETPTNTTVVELLRQDYTSPCVRFQYCTNYTAGSESVQLQIKVGILDMHVPYELEYPDAKDDLVRGLAPGYAVSKVMVQTGFITDGIGDNVSSDPSGFKTFVGGELAVPVSGQTEKWNEVQILFKDTQIWIWYNGLLVSPDPTLSAQLVSPVAVSTPYFPINPQIKVGKAALRMFPGAIVRSMDVLDQISGFNEYTNGQLELTS